MTLDPTRLHAKAKAGFFVAVDPGVTNPAIAIFHNGVLKCAKRVKVPGAAAKLDRLERVRHIVQALAVEVWDFTAGHTPGVIAVEYPQIYRAGKSKGDPNDLLGLAAIGGGLAATFGVEVISPLPAEWIGGIPKNTTGDPWASPRGRVIGSRLTALERAFVVASHDALDAVGIGLKVLRRLERSLPGTT